MVAREKESPRHATNWRRRTRKGPEPACVRAPFGLRGGTRRGEGRINILPWYRPVGVAKTSSETQWRKSRASSPRKWKWPPRGTGTTVLTNPRSAPGVTGKAGEKRSKFRWNVRQLTLDKTVGYRVWWPTQGSGGRPASDLGRGSSSKTPSGSLLTGSLAGRTPPHGDGSMYSQATVRAGKSCSSQLERSRPWSWTQTRCCGKRTGQSEERRWLLKSGGQETCLECASKAGRVGWWGARRSQAFFRKLHVRPSRWTQS